MSTKDYCEGQEVTTGDGETTVRDKGGALKAVIIETDGTNAATVECFDGTQASGTKIFSGTVAAADRTTPFMLPGRGVKFTSKLNVVVTGTGASAWIYHGT